MDEATTEAESYLLADLEYNRSNGVWPSLNGVIESLLNQRAEMRAVYGELARKLSEPYQRRAVILAIVRAAFIAHPDKTQDVRAQIERANRLNREVAEQARALAALLRKRNAACQDVRKPDDCHPVDLLCAAANHCDAETAHLFRTWVEPPLQGMADEFDLKYWPTAAELLDALADAQGETDSLPHVVAVAAAVQARTRSSNDFVRGLWAAVEDLKEGCHPIPQDFALTDESVACCATCILGQDFSAEKVKSLRRRGNKRAGDGSTQKI